MSSKTNFYKVLASASAAFSVLDQTSEASWFPRPLPWEIIESVVRIMDDIPEIMALTKLHQLSLGFSTGTLLKPKLLASGLVRRTHDLGSAPDAVAELLALAHHNKAKGRLTLALAGIQILEAAEIAPGVLLRPFQDVQPPLWFKDLDDERHWPMSESFSPVAPSAALSLDVPLAPAFSHTEDNHNFWGLSL